MNYDGKIAIVAGTNKAGTTSLFQYLSHHPNIHSSTAKQLDYFLNPNYKLVRKVGIKKSSFLEYFKLDGALPSDYLLDVSPDYMYDQTCIQSMQNELDPNTLKIIFILRNPISRLQSWFKYGKQIDMLDKDLSFTDYLSKQSEGLDRHMAFCAQRTGKYMDFIEPFISQFAKENIWIAYFEDMKSNPSTFMHDLMDFLNISKEPYNQYEYQIANKTVQIKSDKFNSAYIALRSAVLNVSQSIPFLSKIINIPGRMVARSYRKINATDTQEEDISKETMDMLVSYYRKSVDALERKTNQKTPWTEFHNNV